MNFPFYELTNNIGQNVSDVHILNYIISLDHLLMLLICIGQSGKKPVAHGLKVSTTPITAMGCQQCLPVSVVQLKGKHCQNPHCSNGVVNTFGQ